MYPCGNVISHESGGSSPRLRILLPAVGAVGSGAILVSLHWMDWASVTIGGQRLPMTGGPTRLVAVSTLTSLICFISLIVVPCLVLRLVLFVACATSVAATVTTALMRIAEANADALGNGSTTNYESGAGVAVIGGFMIIGAGAAELFKLWNRIR